MWEYVLWLSAGFGLVFVCVALRFFAAEAKQAQGADRDELGRNFEKQKALPQFVISLGGIAAWCGERFSPLMSPTSFNKINERLQRAGLEAAITAKQWFGIQCCFGLAGGVLFWVTMSLRQDVLTFQSALIGALGFLLGFVYPPAWLNTEAKRRQLHIRKALPFYIDLIRISIEAGSNTQSALHYAVLYGPPGPLRGEFSKVLSDIKAGMARLKALEGLSQRLAISGVTHLVAAMSNAEKQGASLTDLLTAQAEQRREERFAAAEEMAMKAPVKMLGPLVLFIFPGTFIVLFFPVAVRVFQEGLL